MDQIHIASLHRLVQSSLETLAVDFLDWSHLDRNKPDPLTYYGNLTTSVKRSKYSLDDKILYDSEPFILFLLYWRLHNDSWGC